MLFIIQRENDYRDDEVQISIIESVLNSFKYQHKYIEIKESDLYSEEDDSFENFGTKLKAPEDLPEEYKDAIPFGEISFISKFLRIFHDIDGEISIEIPPCLRKEKFLKRKYSIVPVWDIPRKGNYFIKDATQPKVFSYKGDFEKFIYDEMFEPKTSEFDISFRFDYEHLYQVSEIVNVLSEYRAYIISGQLDNICQFAGDPYETPDMELLKEAIESYNAQPDCPKSYSIDLMVTPRGTAITEVHTYLCLGLYNVNWDEKLLYAYRDSWDYLINHNSPQTEFSNF